MELRRNSHHVFRIMYHFVWIPKYRHKVFIEPYRESLRLIIKKIGYDYNIEIVELEIPTDHIHMVVKSEPKVSPSYIMQIIKSISARNFFKLYPKIKRKYFWGGKLWTQSFFVETVGNVNDEVIHKIGYVILQVLWYSRIIISSVPRLVDSLLFFKLSFVCLLLIYYYD